MYCLKWALDFCHFLAAPGDLSIKPSTSAKRCNFTPERPSIFDEIKTSPTPWTHRKSPLPQPKAPPLHILFDTFIKQCNRHPTSPKSSTLLGRSADIRPFFKRQDAASSFGLFGNVLIGATVDLDQYTRHWVPQPPPGGGRNGIAYPKCNGLAREMSPRASGEISSHLVDVVSVGFRGKRGFCVAGCMENAVRDVGRRRCNARARWCSRRGRTSRVTPHGSKKTTKCPWDPACSRCGLRNSVRFCFLPMRLGIFVASCWAHRRGLNAKDFCGFLIYFGGVKNGAREFYKLTRSKGFLGLFVVFLEVGAFVFAGMGFCVALCVSSWLWWLVVFIWWVSFVLLRCDGLGKTKCLLSCYRRNWFRCFAGCFAFWRGGWALWSVLCLG